MRLDRTGEVTYDQIRLAFDRLPPPDAESGLAYTTAELYGERLRIGRAATGHPVLVVETPAESGVTGPDRHYANLRLRHNRRLRVKEGHDVRTYSVLECIARDQAVQDWFLRLLPSMCHQLAGSTDEALLERQVARLGELFRMFDSKAKKDMTGIWAELFVLSRAQDLLAAVAAWHPTGAATHDFTDGGSHIEVKATSQPQRKHDFSASQLHPAQNVLVASLVLDPSDTGPSVMNLYAALVARLLGDQDMSDKVHRHVMALVGRRLAEADDTRFDVDLAAEGLRCYLARVVPQLAPPFPAGVSSVRFVADLSSVSCINEIDRLGMTLWANLFAR